MGLLESTSLVNYINCESYKFVFTIKLCNKFLFKSFYVVGLLKLACGGEAVQGNNEV